MECLGTLGNGCHRRRVDWNYTVAPLLVLATGLHCDSIWRDVLSMPISGFERKSKSSTVNVTTHH